MATVNRPVEQAPEPTSRAGRPLGVGVLAAIDAVGGGVAALVGLAVLSGGRAIATGWLPPLGAAGLDALHAIAPALPALLYGIGVFLLGVGALLLVQGAGLWRGRPWAWMLAVAFAILHGVGELGSFAGHGLAAETVVGLVIVLITLTYLTRPHVRAYFGWAGAAGRRASRRLG